MFWLIVCIPYDEGEFPLFGSSYLLLLRGLPTGLTFGAFLACSSVG